MARVKEDTMTRRPEDGGEGGGGGEGGEVGEGDLTLTWKEKKGIDVAGRQPDQAPSPGWRKCHLEGEVTTMSLTHVHLKDPERAHEPCIGAPTALQYTLVSLCAFCSSCCK